MVVPAEVATEKRGVLKLNPVPSRLDVPGSIGTRTLAVPRAPARTSAGTSPAFRTIERSKPDVAFAGSICAR